MGISAKDIIKAIKESGGSISMAAKMLGVARITLYEHNKKEKIGDEVEGLRKQCREERCNQRWIYAGSDRKVSITVKSDEGSLILSKNAEHFK
ncbi:MAG: helix-turn-helix domain-containing protein [archaeon]